MKIGGRGLCKPADRYSRSPERKHTYKQSVCKKAEKKDISGSSARLPGNADGMKSEKGNEPELN